MTKKAMALTFAGFVFVSSKLHAIIVSSPPGNIVNGLWFNGIIASVNNPNAPNGNFILGGDLWQDLSTTPGQQYSLVFYAAADLYFGPTLTLDVNLNSQPLVTYETPPYSYNGGINRYNQMHWAAYTDTFIATSTTTDLEFIDENTYDFGLDAVSVVPVPEPAPTTLILMAGLLAVGYSQWLKQARS